MHWTKETTAFRAGTLRCLFAKVTLHDLSPKMPVCAWMSSLDVDQNIGIDEFHWLGTFSLFGLLPKGARVVRRVRDVGSRTDQSFFLPVSDQLCTSARWSCQSSSQVEKANRVFRERQMQPGGRGSEFGFKFGR
jgi:hypothetical protein